jgi:hypothetical protein
MSSLFSQKQWQNFSPDKKAFEMTVPGEMKFGENTIFTEMGNLKVTSYMHQATTDDDNFIYVINYVDYPEGTFHLDSLELIQDFFKISISTNIADLEGELVYMSESNYGKYPGTLYRVNYNKGNAILKSKMYLIGDRFYALQVYTLANKSLNPDMDRFLNGFKLKSK